MKYKVYILIILLSFLFPSKIMDATDLRMKELIPDFKNIEHKMFDLQSSYKKTKKIVINLGSILEGHHGSQGILSPGANMGKVKSEINTVIAHEGGHLGIAKRARQVGEKNFMTNIFNNNRKEILAWLNEPGNPYKSMYPDVTTNREQLGNATEEWLNSLTENDWNKISCFERHT